MFITPYKDKTFCFISNSIADKKKVKIKRTSHNL